MRKVALIILDGWGLGEEKESNAVYMAQTPFFDQLWREYPHTALQTCGEYVGLPEGQMGGSEVGHFTIGAGRIMFQELPRINKSLDNPRDTGGILTIPNFQKFLETAKKESVHLIGMISTGGIHSHQDHLLKLLAIMKAENCKSPIIHFISDGRDTPPNAGKDFAKNLILKLEEMQFGTVVTLSGRFYAMDRDRNMNRTDRAIALITDPQHDIKHIVHSDQTKSPITNLVHAFEYFYAKDIGDEFIEPTLIDHSFTGIKDGETVFFFNFRKDRMKQLITALNAKRPHSPLITMTQYDKDYTYDIIYSKQTIDNTLGEKISKHGLIQLRATETEKFPHVSYFFNGGVEVVFPGEVRNLVPSNKVKHDLIPQMKAKEIAEAVIEETNKILYDFILVNFANPDMVGHTGNFPAVVEAIETVDQNLKILCDDLTKKGYICCITADHGNAEIMWTKTPAFPHTSHTLNPAPFVVYDPTEIKQNLQLSQDEHNGLKLIAGTILQLMGIPDASLKSLISTQN